MSDWIQRILNPSGGQSSTRLVLLWLVGNATAMGWYIIICGTEHATEAAGVMVAVTGLGSGLKLIQNRQEANQP